MIKKIKKILLRLFDRLFPNKLYGTTSYSQDGEDILLASFYEDKRDYKGFYIDVGAHHPYRFSNTCYFYKRGWHGINIEPTPDLFKRFKCRHRDINLNCGIGNGEKLDFYVFNEGALNTFDKELAQQRDGSHNNKYKIKEVLSIQTRSLKDIFDEYLPANTKIDFITIDVEGMDFNVLKSNDWTKYNPEFILVECAEKIDSIGSDEVYQYLTAKNYSMVGRTRRTSLFHYGG
ncbi:MAG: FkbM family methyltransferase [Bacteroidales bacterium]|nr:FkbM family methyltransferase [Bacteroidales bacterium]